jgi:hypothetical protein
MSLHINRFIDRLKAAESRNQRDFTMTLVEARDLHSDITKLLLALQEVSAKNTEATQEIKVEITGGSF